MREIKFRGQRVDNGEWVYGCLVNNLFYTRENNIPCCYIIPDQLPDGEEYYYDCFEDVANWIEEFRVIPSTVGQYTGLKDKNGKEVYEGDILKDKDGIIYKVVFDCCQFQKVSLISSNLHNSSEYLQLEVIGNIHDNKELLK